jgi:hypothetical protein
MFNYLIYFLMFLQIFILIDDYLTLSSTNNLVYSPFHKNSLPGIHTRPEANIEWGWRQNNQTLYFVRFFIEQISITNFLVEKL